MRAGLTMGALSCVLSGIATAQCGWSDRFAAPGAGEGVNARIYDMVVHDFGLGAGPQLIAGGSFTAAGSVGAATHVAAFDGTSWSAAGGSGVTNNVVFGLDSSPNWGVVAGGAFTQIDGVAARRVALFDGSTWWPVLDVSTGVDGVDGDVYSVLVHDFGFPFSTVLFAGGLFTSAGGKAANNVAIWDGGNWFPLGNFPCGGGTAGGSFSGRVDALCVFDDGAGPKLYVGGFFASVDCGTPASRVASWDPFTNTWAAVGALAGTNVYDLIVFDDGAGPALYAGGDLPGMGNVVRWDGLSWTTVGDGLNDAVRDLLVYQCSGAPQLVAAGHFTASNGGAACPRAARLLGAEWVGFDDAGAGISGSVGGSPPIGLCMADFDDGEHLEDLHIGGIFNTAGGAPSSFIAATCACAAAPFPMINGEVAVTTMGDVDDAFVLSLVDVRPPFPAPNTNWRAPMFHNEFAPSAPSEVWTRANLGQVFGVCLDTASPPNIYVASTSIYPNISKVFTPDGPGAVFKIDGASGDISTFLTTGSGALGSATLPNTGPALGDICYDRFRDQFFVSNFEDGKIYRIKGGVVVQTLDPFAADNGAAGLAPLGERVWAVQVFNPRQLYFSRWSEDGASNGPFVPDNSIWVATLNGDGSFSGATAKVIDLPPESGQFFAMPCSDITFSPDNKRMLIAQRTMVGGTESLAHASAVQEFIGGSISSVAWTRTGANDHWVGAYVGHLNAAGGADYDCSLAVFATGDALRFAVGAYIYGLQRIPPGGNTFGAGATSTSQLHDMNGETSVSNKVEIGDCEVYRPACPSKVWWYCSSKLNSLGCYPAIDAVGQASASMSSGFTVSCSQLVGQKLGLMFYGTQGPHAAPFQGGTLCVKPPLRRTPAANSGGTPSACDGALAVDMNAFAAGGSNPTLLIPGTLVACQFWARDPASPSTTSLSDALEYYIDF